MKPWRWAWTLDIEVDGCDASAWTIERFEMREAVSEGCRGWVAIVAAARVGAEALVYKTAVLTVRAADQPARRFHGIVLAATAEARSNGTTLLRLELGARAELLRFGRDARIFQKKSIPEIVTQVTARLLGNGGIQWRTTGAYEPHPYVVQYAESDQAFMERLLFEEGIWFAVHNDDERDRVVFYDELAGIEPIAGPAVLWHWETEKAGGDDGDRDGSQCVVSMSDCQVVASDAVMLRDYDFTHPSLDVSVQETTVASTGREVYVHPGDFPAFAAGADRIDKNVGARRARRMLERLRADTRQMVGRSYCAQLEPGRTFRLEGHPRAVMNGEHLVVGIVHRGQRAETGWAYTNELRTVPSTLACRPAKAPPAPWLGGIQSAQVTCPPREEIHADESGRVKVRFPWDRSAPGDDTSSTWLRVGQLALGGSMILPRKEFEVTVGFELGDMDRPLVTGHLYNGLHKPPYALPARATRSSIQTATTGGGGGANELRFEDGAGAEEIFLNASRDYSVNVANDASVDCVASETYKVGANRELSVGVDYSSTVKASRTLQVGGSQDINVGGNHSDGVGGAEMVSVAGARSVKCGGDLDESVKATLTRSVGAILCVTGIAGYTRAVTGASTTKVGGVWCEVAGGDRSSVAASSRTEAVGALKLVKAKAVAVSAGGAYTANVGGYSVQCAGGRTDSAMGAVSVAAAGGWSVQASKIAFTAESRLVLIAGGTTVTLTSGGSITIKAAGSITLHGVDKLTQAQHKSGG